MFTQPKFFLLSAIFVAMVSGCVPTTRYVWKSDPVNQSVNNESFTARISPSSCGNLGCEAFRLTVKNNTNKNLELDWNKTLYIVHGQTSGSFMFEGVVYKDRNNPKSPDIVFPGGELSKNIWPNNLVEYSSGRYGGWRNEAMPSGENGVYLTVVVDGKEISEKITTVLTKTQMTPMATRQSVNMDINSKLHKAIINNDYNTAEKLINEGADANYHSKDDIDNTPLIVAAAKGYIECIKLLLCKGADINSRNDKGNTSLMGAAALGRLEAAKLLVSFGATVDLKNNIGLTALDFAEQLKKKEIVEYLKSAAGHSNTKSDSLDRTSLCVNTDSAEKPK